MPNYFFSFNDDFAGAPYDLSRIPSRRSTEWESMANEILAGFNGGLHPKHEGNLIVVHPHDKYWNDAIDALEADNWNPEWKIPFYTRYLSKWGGEWWILEILPELDPANWNGPRRQIKLVPRTDYYRREYTAC